MKKITALAAGLLIVGGLAAQNFEDALRASEVFPRGNARFMSMSGAMGALGGNMSAISVNPAGSAISRAGAMEITPAFSYIKSENHYQGNYERRFDAAFRVPNFGLMVARNTPNAGVLSGVSYGFAINNQNIYDASIRYETQRAKSSFTDEALRNAEMTNGELDNFTNLFWDTYLLRQDDYGFYTDFTEFDPATYGQRQTAVINTSGGKNEYLFNLGFDFSQYVYLGVDLSIQSINYQREFLIEEENNSRNTTGIWQNLDYFNNFVYRENLLISGNGFTGKFGIIARPLEFLRLGLAYHTPTKFFLSEEQTYRLNASFNNMPDPDSEGGSDIINSASTRDSRIYDYSVSTPGRAIASVGFVFKNIATIGFDYESVNYENACLDSYDYSFSKENNVTEMNLSRVDNLKIGTEVNYGMYSFRLGTAFYGNPYESYKNDETFYRTDISAGVGMKTINGFYCDLACVKSTQTKYNYLYTNLDDADVMGKSKLKKTDLALTLGFKF